MEVSGMVITWIARLLGSVTSVYMILCALRVFMTWAPQIEMGKPGTILRRIVDPYLSIFSRIPLFRTERFDFSPIAALAVLSVANNMLASIAVSGSVSIGLLLSLVLGAAWSAISFVLSFLAVCAFARIVVFIAHWNSLHPIWVVIDGVLNPILYQINKFIYRNKAVDYLQGLITGFLALVIFRGLGGTLIHILERLFVSLPF
jgi:YggT family protein